MEIHHLPLEEIYSDPDFNCRGAIIPFHVVELARSIDTQGLQQAISVQPYVNPDRPGKKWRIILGHRRFEAFKLLHKECLEKATTDEAKNKYGVIPCTVQMNLTELDARVLNLNENLERQNLNIMQEARALMPFINARWTQAQIATRLNQSTGWVQIRITALKLEPEIQQEIEAGYLNQQQIKDLAGLHSKEQRFEVVRDLKDAKVRGEKAFNVKKVVEKKIGQKDIKKKKFRTQGEIFQMQEHIQDTIGNNFGTRCLAWAAGEINDEELFEDIKELADEKGVSYTIPEVGLTALARAEG